MVPKSNVFEAACISLAILGISRETTGIRSQLMSVLNGIVIIDETIYVIASTVGIFQPGVTFQLRLENFMLMLSAVSILWGALFTTYHKKRLFRCIDRVNETISEMEEEFGSTTTSDLWKAKTTSIAVTFGAIVAGCVLPPYLWAHYRYYVLGELDAVPYEMYIPFDRKAGVSLISAYLLSMVVIPSISVVTVKATLGTFAITTSKMVEKTREKFESVNGSNYESALKQAIRWHSAVILMVKETNHIFGSVFAFEYISTIVSVCCSSYLMASSGSDSSENFFKYLCTGIAMSSFPLFTCICGHAISNENDKLYESIYCNGWYEIPAKSRKKLIPSMILTSKGLTWHSRQLIVYNLASYLFMIRQSYAMFTLIISVNDK